MNAVQMPWISTIISTRLAQTTVKISGSQPTQIALQVVNLIQTRLWRQCLKDWAKLIDHLTGQWGINKRPHHHLRWAHTCVGFVQSHTKLTNAHHICPTRTNLLQDASAKCVDGTQRISQGSVDTLIVWREKGTMLDKVARSPINRITKVGTFETIHTKKWQDQC